ncbi:MAG: hypothetical protein K2K56_09170 [Lachnospiraceae bacterium]|nr:hypothetical protein [Lachnospiraceae bacterium]
MALRISDEIAKYQLMQYADLINEVEKQAEKNFKDMDFENADRRDDMEEIIGNMKRECANAISEMEQLSFE